MDDVTISPSDWAMIVSLVASVITVVGFIASIWFFLSGSQLQREAQNALTRIESLASAINDRTGDQFSKLIDAVSRARDQVTASIDEGDAATDKVAETFEQLQAEVQRAAARQVVEGPKATIHALADNDAKGESKLRFKEWLSQKRAQEADQLKAVQSVLDVMREVGPLTPDELVKLSPFSTYELEETGLIHFEKGHWVVRKNTSQN